MDRTRDPYGHPYVHLDYISYNDRHFGDHHIKNMVEHYRYFENGVMHHYNSYRFHIHTARHTNGENADRDLLNGNHHERRFLGRWQAQDIRRYTGGPRHRVFHDARTVSLNIFSDEHEEDYVRQDGHDSCDEVD